MRALVLACLVLAVGAGCGSVEDQTAPSEPTTTTTEPTKTESREAAPRLAGEALDGSPIELADFRGRPVLVNVWSSW
jgi:uncharacterized protein YceK